MKKSSDFFGHDMMMPKKRGFKAMKIIMIVPGSGGHFYCDNCLRDNYLLKELTRRKHDVLSIPMYLPLLTDSGMSKDTPVFFGGINVYLQQKFGVFRRTPRWLDKIFDAAPLLKWVARFSVMTDSRDLGDSMISMLKGEHGHQRKELERLLEFLKTHTDGRPDVIILSNVLLAGLAPRLTEVLGAPVAALLQGEEPYLDLIPEPEKSKSWELLHKNCEGIPLFFSTNEFYKKRMSERLGIAAGRIHILPNGIDPKRYSQNDEGPEKPRGIGYMSPYVKEKGLDRLVNAYIHLARLNEFADLRLYISGDALRDNDPFVVGIRKQIAAAGLTDRVTIAPNLTHHEKTAFFKSLSVLSVPAVDRDTSGFFSLEALASGVPLVGPDDGPFPELIRQTGGGIVCKAHNEESLMEALAQVLRDTEKRKAMGAAGRRSVAQHFHVTQVADRLIGLLEQSLK